MAFSLLIIPIESNASNSFFTYDTESATTEEYFKKIKVDVTLVSSNGCEVHIEGTLDVDIWAMEINGFEGTVTISGGAGCPNGSMTFNRVANTADATISIDSNTCGKVGDVQFAASSKFSSFISIVNEPQIRSAITNSINSSCAN